MFGGTPERFDIGEDDAMVNARDDSPGKRFVPFISFGGAWPGYYFAKGSLGLGYYLDDGKNNNLADSIGPLKTIVPMGSLAG